MPPHAYITYEGPGIRYHVLPARLFPSSFRPVTLPSPLVVTPCHSPIGLDDFQLSLHFQQPWSTGTSPGLVRLLCPSSGLFVASKKAHKTSRSRPTEPARFSTNKTDKNQTIPSERKGISDLHGATNHGPHCFIREG